MPFSSSTGLVIKDVDTIFEEINTELLINLRELTGDSTLVIDTSEYSPIGKLNKIHATRVYELYQVAEQIEDSMRADKASGVSLEKLALLVGFVRNPATNTTGNLRFFGDNGTVITNDNIFANVQNDKFVNSDNVIIDLENCYSLRTQTGIIKNSREYSITVNDYITTITSSSSDSTNLSILTQLSDELNSVDYPINIIASVDIDEEVLEDDSEYFLKIETGDQSVPIKVVISPLLTSSYVEVEGLVQAVEIGVIYGAADTVNIIITSLNGLVEVNNPSDFILGEVTETDEELLSNITNDYNVVGSSTYSTIKSIFEKNTNVRSVSIDENRLTVTNSTGVPPKAYEVILSHEGTSQEMGQIVWDTAPDGILTHGNIEINITDEIGDSQLVYYTEATDLFVYFKVDMTLLPEEEGEVIQTNYKDLISDACTLQGEDYEIGQDIYGQMFYGTVYSSVNQIDDLDIQVHLSTEEDLVIDDITDWRDNWSVGREEISTYGNNRFLINII